MAIKIFTAAFLGKVVGGLCVSLFIAVCIALGFGPDRWAAVILGFSPTATARFVFLILALGTGYVVLWPTVVRFLRRIRRAERKRILFPIIVTSLLGLGFIGSLAWLYRSAGNARVAVHNDPQPPHAVPSPSQIPTPLPPVGAPVANPSPPSQPQPIPSPPITTVAPVEDVERQQLLKSRGEMELAVRDAGGIPLKHQFNTQSMETIKVSDGSTTYEISTHVAHATAVWLNIGIGSGSVKKLYVSKSAQRGKPIDIRQLRVSKGSDTISIGQRAFIELEDGKILQLLLVGVLWYRAGDAVDEARFKYKIYDAGQFWIDPL